MAAVVPDLYPVIPAKAGIQMGAAKFATRNQVQITASGSLLPLWEKARMRVRRAQARLVRAGRPRSQGRKTASDFLTAIPPLYPVIPSRSTTSFPPYTPAIPAKAGIHRAASAV